MTEIQGKSISVRVSARFESARVRVFRESTVVAWRQTDPYGDHGDEEVKKRMKQNNIYLI